MSEQTILCCSQHALCVDASGVEIWRHDHGADLRASPVYVEATNEVIVSGVDGRCDFLDAQTGAFRGSIRLDGKIVASPAVSMGVAVFGLTDDDAVGVDVRTRAVQWRRRGSAPRDHSSFSVTPAGDFIVATSRGNIVCLTPGDGQFLWETSQLLGLPNHDPKVDTTPIAAADGSLYCGSYSGMLYHFRFAMMDLGTGHDGEAQAA